MEPVEYTGILVDGKKYGHVSNRILGMRGRVFVAERVKQ